MPLCYVFRGRYRMTPKHFELIDDDTYNFEGCGNELFSLLKAIETISKENIKL